MQRTSPAGCDGCGLDGCGDEPLRFTLPGVASWALAPRSTVVIASLGVPHLLVLEEGEVTAQVVPKPSSATQESFAVEAGPSRVAVRGTVFSVDRSDDRVTVQVHHGKVMVGPAGTSGATDGHLLVGPSQASFSLTRTDARGGERLARAPAEAAAQVDGPPSAGEPEALKHPLAASRPWALGGEPAPAASASSGAPSPSGTPAASAERA